MEATQLKFDCWAIVEVFGHQKYAGRVSEQAIGGCQFVRLDVAEIPARKEKSFRTVYENGTGKRVEAERLIPGRPAFSKIFGQGAIYSITPVTEQDAQRAAAMMRAEAIAFYIPAQIEAPEEEEQDDGEDDKDAEADEGWRTVGNMPF